MEILSKISAKRIRGMVASTITRRSEARLRLVETGQKGQCEEMKNCALNSLRF